MTILDTILAHKRTEIAALRPRAAELKRLTAARSERRDFAAASRRPDGRVALIAEAKKASPSAGVIRPDFDPVAIARDSERGGASCLSVLTDEKFFQGHLDYLRRIREAVKLPLLRKDFIIDEIQVCEAVAAGADCVLLIVACLEQEELVHLLKVAADCRLDALVEVHDEAELDRALAAGAQIIGVNNRDLKTFKVDLATTERLAKRMRSAECGVRNAERILVAESGIHTRADVERLARCGVNAILVGESLMRSTDVLVKMRELMGAP
ncbi:MAG: indole-3-glycerol phosphate synthase TrpC [Verrucomicrobia bacterium]|nr:indole-3-glycerol phosphate synthase TrpC [Verrucomicrobiota bacterium]